MAKESFDLIAQSRANYYTKGSPVQFVRVEMLKGSKNGDIAVSLTFKNIGSEPLKSLTVHFICKNKNGQVLAEDDFRYTKLNIADGELFGMDDAVVLLEERVANVEVHLVEAKIGREKVDLSQYRRERLPQPAKLEPEVRAALESRVKTGKLIYEITELPQGWFCACGAFHPAEELTVRCSECGGDKILWKSELEKINRELNAFAVPEEQPQVLEEPVMMQGRPVEAIFAAEAEPAEEAAEEETVKEWKPAKATENGGEKDEYATRPFRGLDTMAQETYYAQPQPQAAPKAQELPKEDEAGSGYSASRAKEALQQRRKGDALARKVLRLAPPITAGACAAVILLGVLLSKVLG